MNLILGDWGSWVRIPPLRPIFGRTLAVALTVSSATAIAIFTIDRPPVNALDLPTPADLQAALAAHNPDTPLILTGAGQLFCAGGDTRAFAGYTQAERQRTAHAITRVLAALLAVPAPVVAAVNGHTSAQDRSWRTCREP